MVGVVRLDCSMRCQRGAPMLCQGRPRRVVASMWSAFSRKLRVASSWSVGGACWVVRLLPCDMPRRGRKLIDLVVSALIEVSLKARALSPREVQPC